MNWRDQMPWISFFECWVSSQLFHSLFLPSSRDSLVPLCFLPLQWYHLHIWGYWYSSQQSWFLVKLHLAQHFALKLNKQGDNIQPGSTPFPILNQSIAPCLILTVPLWPAYQFLRRYEKRFSFCLVETRIFHSLLWPTQVKGFSIVSEAEVGAFLEFPCFFYDPTDVGNLISGSSAFSKTSLYIRKTLVHLSWRRA